MVACLAPAIASAAEPLPRSVLVLDQSIPHTAWFRGLFSAFQSTLNAGSNTPITIYSEKLEYSHFKGSEYDQVMREFIKAKYREKPIGVTVAIGIEAFRFALSLRDHLGSSMPIVFGDIDDRVLAQSKLPADVTGTTVRSTVRDAVISAKALVPDLKRIALVGVPLEREPFRRHYKDELPVYAGDLEQIDLTGLAMPEVRKRVAALPEDTAIFYMSLSIDGAGARYDPNDALALVAEVANRPIVIDQETRLGRGATGGFILAAAPIGEATARIVLRLLNGESASTIPVTTGAFVKPVFDWRALQRWNVSEQRLPPGSEIRFREATAWEQYRRQLSAGVAVVLLQAAMIAWLLFERHRRSAAEVEAGSRRRQVIHLNRVATATVLSSSIAHELSQPLGAMLLNIQTAQQLLKEDPPDLGQVDEILSDAVRDDQRASDILHRQGNLLRKEQATDLQVVDLNDVVREVIAIVAPEAARRRIVLNADGTEGLPVRGHRVQMQQVLLNLVMNGMDSLENSPPAQRKVTVRVARNGAGLAEVAVSDSGHGIPEDKLTTIFNAFFTTKPNGTGLGLPIARTIVETHGGAIWARNRPGGGAAFHFTLPLTEARSG